MNQGRSEALDRRTLFPSLIEGLYFLMLCAVCLTLFMPIKMNSMAIGFLFLSWIPTAPWRRFEQLKRQPVLLAMISFFLLYAIGMFYTQNLPEGEAELSQKLPFLALPLIIGTGPVIKSPQFRVLIRLFYLALFAITLFACILALRAYTGALEPEAFISYFTYRNFTMPVGFDPIYLGLYTVLGIFLLVYDRILDADFALKRQTPWWTWLMLALFFVSLIFISSRMEILVFIASASLLLLRFAWQSGKWLGSLVIMGLIPLFSYGLIALNDVNKERFSEMVDLESDYTENKWGGRSIRIEKWKNAMQCWMKAPVFGVGTGDTMDELMTVYSDNDFDLAFDNRFNPHNQYLETAIATGVFGLLILLFILGGPVIRGWRHQDWLLLIVAMIFSLSMITESMLERQKGFTLIVYFLTVLALSSALRSKEMVKYKL